MPTICPNCQHAVRTGAQFCGFCGTSLISAPVVETIASPGFPEKDSSNLNAKPGKQSKSRRFRTSQVVVTISIILLFLVIILSVLVRYWSEIPALLGQLLSLLAGQ